MIYYGNVRKSAAELGALKGPVLLHYGLQDQYINTAMVQGFEAAAKEAGKSVTVYGYDAGHAFANPTGANYHQSDAQLAWQRTLAFLKQYD